MKRVLCAGILILASCGQKPPAVVRYDTEIAPLLVRKCMACHNDMEAQANVNVQSYAQVMASRTSRTHQELVRPGVPDSSLLFQVIATSDPKRMMPPPGAEAVALDPTQIELVRRWIAEGATPPGASTQHDGSQSGE